MTDHNQVTDTINRVLAELINMSNLKKNDIVIIGCSTSEVVGKRIGTSPNKMISKSLMKGILPAIKENNLFLAIQCCEHLNRALVVEYDCTEYHGLERVSVYPCAKAGGAMSEAAMETFDNPVVVSSVKGNAALDIGNTLIGMHLREVAVPVRFSIKKIGKAGLTGAYTRPKLIGGERAIYKK